MRSVLALALVLSVLSLPAADHAAALTSHAPIWIDSNAQFTAANGVVGGSGVVGDPFVISGWDIDASTAAGIHIEDTTAHFVVRDLSVHDGGTDERGMHFRNVRNFLVENVTLTDNEYGLYIYQCENGVIRGNTVEIAEWSGISTYECTDIRIEDNEVSWTGRTGIANGPSVNATVLRNRVWNAGLAGSGAGIHFGYAVNATVADNEAWMVDDFGIAFSTSWNVTVTDNYVWSNQGGGLFFHDAENATVQGNEMFDGFYGALVWVVRNSTIRDNYAHFNALGIAFGTTVGGPTWENDDNLVEGNNVSRNSRGIELEGNTRVTVRNNVAYENTFAGIRSTLTRESTVEGNHFIDNDYGVYALDSWDLNISENAFTGNGYGVYLSFVYDSVISGNGIEGNTNGIHLTQADNIDVYHNLLLGNGVQAYDDQGATNTWDDGYPSGGNWWSDYGGVDVCSGPNQDVCPSPDGIGDTPYVIDADSQDRYPLWTPSEIDPAAAFSVDPASGDIATTFGFNASASWDFEDDANLELRWDWEDDGTYDTGWSTSRFSTHQYAAPGLYTARLEVRDVDGLTDETTRPVEVLNRGPVANFTVTPGIGGTHTDFIVNASASSDLEDPAALEVRWDWEDDGTYDTGWTASRTANHSYATPGTYRIRLQVRDSYGALAEDVETVDVRPGPITSLDVGVPNYLSAETFVRSSTPLALSAIDQSGLGINRTLYRLDGGAWADYGVTGPFNLSGDGAHLIEWYSEDNLGSVEEIQNRTLIVDDSPPSASLAVGSPAYLSGDLWVTSATPLTINASDAGSPAVGLDAVEYRVWDGAWSAWTPYTAPFTLSGEGQRFVEYRASDRLGSTSATGNETYSVDNLSPTSSIFIGDPQHLATDLFITSATPIALNATDGGVGVDVLEYRIDGGVWTSYAGPFDLAGVEGTRTVEYAARDHLGNVEATASIQLVVDDTPPTVALDIGLPRHDDGNVYVRSSSILSLQATDGGAVPVGLAEVSYRTWQGAWSPWAPYAGGFVLSGDDGIRYVEYRASDHLGHESSGNATMVLDNTHPETTFFPGTGEFGNETSFSMAAEDTGSGVLRTEFRIDGGSWTVYQDPFRLDPGEHRIEYQSSDYLGNLEPVRSVLLNILEPDTPPVDPREGSVNAKPFVAAAFAITLAAVGYLAAEDRVDRAGRTPKRRWLLMSLPFVAAEVATGVVSALTGLLSIPPLIGLGTVVDVSILAAGIALVLVYRRKRTEPAA